MPGRPVPAPAVLLELLEEFGLCYPVRAPDLAYVFPSLRTEGRHCYAHQEAAGRLAGLDLAFDGAPVPVLHLFALGPSLVWLEQVGKSSPVFTPVEAPSALTARWRCLCA